MKVVLIARRAIHKMLKGKVDVVHFLAPRRFSNLLAFQSFHFKFT
jgi:hypothetical protein